MRIAAQIAVLAAIATVIGCGSGITQISGTPTASRVLANARVVASQLESYRATVTTSEKTVHLRASSADSSKVTVRQIVVASESNFSVDQPDYDFRYVRLGDFGYTQSGSGSWAVEPVGRNEIDLLPGEQSERPPEHPMEWLDRRYVVNTEYHGGATINGRAVHVITGRIPMLPGGISDDPGIPHDDVQLYIDAKSFQILRIEIDQNILDSLREDSGYQVIPGVIEIDTTADHRLLRPQLRDHRRCPGRRS